MPWLFFVLRHWLPLILWKDTEFCTQETGNTIRITQFTLLWEIQNFFWNPFKFPWEWGKFEKMIERGSYVCIIVVARYKISHRLERRTKHLILRVWKPFSIIRVLKLWGWRWYVMGQNGQYLLEVGLRCYKWYQSQKLDSVPERTLAPKGVDYEIMRPHIDWRGEQNIP